MIGDDKVEQYSIDFEGKNNSLNKNNISNITCFNVFNGYSGPKIGLNRFVSTLYNDQWQIVEEIINPDYESFICYSHKYNAMLTINISTLPEYRKANNIEYESAFNLLREMSINATKTNNKIIDIRNFVSTANTSNNNHNITMVDNKKNDIMSLSKVKNVHIYPGTKRIFSKRAKIALATLAASMTAIITGLAFYNATKENSSQQYENENKFSYVQNYNESPIPNISQEAYDRSIEVAQNRANNR